MLPSHSNALEAATARLPRPTNATVCTNLLAQRSIKQLNRLYLRTLTGDSRCSRDPDPSKIEHQATQHPGDGSLHHRQLAFSGRPPGQIAAFVHNRLMHAASIGTLRCRPKRRGSLEPSARNNVSRMPAGRMHTCRRQGQARHLTLHLEHDVRSRLMSAIPSWSVNMG